MTDRLDLTQTGTAYVIQDRITDGDLDHIRVVAVVHDPTRAVRIETYLRDLARDARTRGLRDDIARLTGTRPRFDLDPEGGDRTLRDTARALLITHGVLGIDSGDLELRVCYRALANESYALFTEALPALDAADTEADDRPGLNALADELADWTPETGRPIHAIVRDYLALEIGGAGFLGNRIRGLADLTQDLQPPRDLQIQAARWIKRQLDNIRGV